MTPRLAPRRIKRPRTLAAQLCALAISLSFASPALAAIKVTSVVGASNTKNIGGSETETPVIFGGVTGTSLSAVPTGVVCGGDGYCDSCAAATTSINTTAAPCNKLAITTATRLVIQFTAGKAGFPILMNEEKTTVIAEGTSSVAIGGTAEIITTWGDVCTAIPTALGCNPSSTEEVGTETLFIGVTKDDDNDLGDTDDESSQLTATVSDSMGVAGRASGEPDCDGAAGISICEFSIQSGDEKAVLTNLGKVGNFPALEGINISAMRVYFEQCNWGPGVDLPGFAAIKPSSNFVDLEITTDANGIPELVENEITGLSNQVTYCAKIGHVDEAMNVGLFTPGDNLTAAAGDGNCVKNYLKQNETTDWPNSCHVARPDEVLGVLAESCFIATAAYGSPWATKVQTFRDFRNQFLLSNNIGRQLVKFYYKHSKVFAKKIAKSTTARAITRGALSPIWIFARVSLKIGLLATTLLTFGLFASPIVFLAYCRKNLKAAR